MKVIDMTNSEQIRKMRTENGLTQEQAAELLLVHRRTYQRWEAETRHCPDSAVLLFRFQLIELKRAK